MFSCVFVGGTCRGIGRMNPQNSNRQIPSRISIPSTSARISIAADGFGIIVAGFRPDSNRMSAPASSFSSARGPILFPS